MATQLNIKTFGPWRLENRCLKIALTPAFDYEIDIEEFRTEQDLAHWIEHLSLKRWFTADVRANLERVFGELRC